MAPVLLGYQHAVFSALTIQILNSVVTPLFTIPGIFVALIYLVIGKLYINSLRDLNRIESLHRSPLYQQLDETPAGIVTIRAYGREEQILPRSLGAARQSFSRLSLPLGYQYMVGVPCGSHKRLDFIPFLARAFVATSAGKISPGTAGLSLTYAITFTEHVLWLVSLYAVNEQNMDS